jgi:hypothetical protein
MSQRVTLLHDIMQNDIYPVRIRIIPQDREIMIPRVSFFGRYHAIHTKKSVWLVAKYAAQKSSVVGSEIYCGKEKLRDIAN